MRTAHFPILPLAISVKNECTFPGADKNADAAHDFGATLTIQPMPKRSCNMPNFGDQKVFVSGIRTCPPSASAVKLRSASASVATLSASEKPENFPSSGEHPSDAISVLPPMRNVVCI